MVNVIDEPGAVRPGQGFDGAALDAWLRPRLREQGVELEGEPELLQFGRGYSNLTYLVRFREHELVLRRSPPGVRIKSAHDMGREVRILSALAPHWPKAPRPLLHCDDASVLGTPFYVMERVRGVVLRAKTPAGLVLDDGTMHAVSRATCDTLAEIHSLDWRAVGLGDLGKPEGYIERQVRGWAERYAAARTEDVPDMGRLGAWLEDHRPRENAATGVPGGAGAATLVHNDFKYDNIVLAPDLSRVVAVLDWEMATIGDPLMDLGTALGYWIQADDPPVFQVAIFGPTNRPGNLTRVEFAERWSRATGRDASNILFYYAFALFKLAVVAAQLYKRWVDGHTQEERYAAMLEGVRAVARSALVAIDKGRIDRLGD
jgi:aminoglycoside phosphotransferase (APT) family kinase protein